MRKKVLIILSCLVTCCVIVLCVFSYQKYQANKTINDLISKQGIKQTDIEIENLSYDFKMSTFEKRIYLRKENSDFYYSYSYHPNSKRILFSAVYQNKSDYQKDKLWGGTYLTKEESIQKLEYPKLNKKYFKDVYYIK